MITYVTNRELEGINLDGHLLDLEDAVAHVLPLSGRASCRDNLDFDGDTVAANEDICQTRILDLGEASLFAEIESNVAEVGMDLTEAESESVMGFVLDRGIRGKLEVVLGGRLNDARPWSGFGEFTCIKWDVLGEDVLSLKGKILDNEVEGLVGVLDARDGDVADLLSQCGKDDGADIVPELRLELETAFLIEEEVASESGPVVTKTLVETIVGPGGEPLLDGIKEFVAMTLVLLVEEYAGLVP